MCWLRGLATDFVDFLPHQTCFQLAGMLAQSNRSSRYRRARL
jgi:hypothetical protein